MSCGGRQREGALLTRHARGLITHKVQMRSMLSCDPALRVMAAVVATHPVLDVVEVSGALFFRWPCSSCSRMSMLVLIGGAERNPRPPVTAAIEGLSTISIRDTSGRVASTRV